MDADFPAAHSMDSSWYAVDKDGNVALFHTGAGGAMPENAYSPEAAEYVEELDDETREELDIVDLDPKQLPPEKRVFVYHTGQMDEALADRYQRKRVPKNPIHVDELPPAVRDALGRVRFDGLAFSETKVFQPVELTPCATWDAAYLAGDGKTVKPVPGREEEYAQFFREYHNEFGEFKFEPPGE
jgi:hypothetical protein